MNNFLNRHLNQIFSYGLGLVAACTALWAYQRYSYVPVSTLQLVLVSILTWQLLASTSLKLLSQDLPQRPYALQWLFLALHGVHIYLLGILFPIGWIYYLGIAGYILLAGSITLAIRHPIQRGLGLTFFVFGCFLLMFVMPIPKLLLWLLVLLFAKVLLV